MKIAIAIPTYNRLDKLKRAVSSILQQEGLQDFNLSLIISNIQSTDKTSEYLEQLNRDHENVIIYNYAENKGANLYYLATTVPDDIDWVWLMGDDDYLMQNNSVQTVCNTIREHQELDLCLLHACQGRRSRSTGSVVIGEIFDLCNKFGYHEMLGWMSSIVIRKNEFTSTFENQKDLTKLNSNILQERAAFSAFWHSPIIFKNCVGKDCMFVDLPLVESQDKHQTVDTTKRWAIDNTTERYLFVANDLYINFHW